MGSHGMITWRKYDQPSVDFGLHFNKATKTVANLSKPEDRAFPTGSVLRCC